MISFLKSCFGVIEDDIAKKSAKMVKKTIKKEFEHFKQLTPRRTTSRSLEKKG